MDQSEASGSSQLSAKRRREDGGKDQREDGTAVAATVEQTADILKLDIDCCEEAFDYLAFKDLVRVGKTCKRLQQVAGYCFQQNYGAVEVECRSNGIQKVVEFEYRSNGIIKTDVDVEHFAPFIRKIEIWNDDLQYFFDMGSKFKRLEQIQFNDLRSTDVVCLKKVPTSKLGSLCFKNCDLSDNFHEIIDDCVSLKCLSISDCRGEHDLFTRKYPTLERFEYIPKDDDINKNLYDDIQMSDDIKMFLELNPNIRNFAMSAKWLDENWHEMMTADVKLDELYIFNDYVDDGLLIYMLNKLHERGFYRKLHLELMHVRQERIDKLVTLNGLVKLSTVVYHDLLKFSALNNLEQLHVVFRCVADIQPINDGEMMANNLINLKRIKLGQVSIDTIMPFIRRSVGIQKICIYIIEGGVHFNKETNVIDLLALNRERKQLTDAQKITLYVGEEVYLATKWAMKETDFALIQMRRMYSYEWNQFLGKFI